MRYLVPLFAIIEWCKCSYPQTGTVGKNEIKCYDFKDEVEISYCAADEECYANEPFRSEYWEDGCRKPGNSPILI